MYDFYTQGFLKSENDLRGFILLVLILFAIIFTIVYVYLGICYSQIFKKSGKAESWKAWVPIYNSWTLNGLVNRPGWWALVNLGALLPIRGVSNLFSLVSVALTIIVCIDLAKAFGQSSGYGVALGFLPIPMLAILAFGNYEFIGTDSPNAQSISSSSVKEAPKIDTTDKVNKKAKTKK